MHTAEYQFQFLTAQCKEKKQPKEKENKKNTKKRFQEH